MGSEPEFEGCGICGLVDSARRVLRRAKDFYRCLNTLESFTDGRAHVVSWDEVKMDSLVVELFPHQGALKGTSIKFRIKMWCNCAPEVYCMDPVVPHPNIRPGDGHVCLNILDNSDWAELPGGGIDDIVMGLLYLLYNPNFDSPYWSPDGAWGEENREGFLTDVQTWATGESVQDGSFSRIPEVDLENPLQGRPAVEECSGGGPVPQLPLISRVMANVATAMNQGNSDGDSRAPLGIPKSKSFLCLEHTFNLWNSLPQEQPQGPTTANPDDETKEDISSPEVMPSIGVFKSGTGCKSSRLRRSVSWHPDVSYQD